MKLITLLLLLGLTVSGCQTRQTNEEIQRFPDGSISARCSGYKNKSGKFIYHGKQTFWDQRGRIILAGSSSEGSSEGEWRWWNGEEYFRSVYKDGKAWKGIFRTPVAMHGPWVDPGLRYEDGKQVARNR